MHDGVLTEADFIPLIPDGPDPERVPVFHGPKRKLPDGKAAPQAVDRPPRCDRCLAYLNPFCVPVSTGSFVRGAHSPVQQYAAACAALRPPSR